MNSRVLVSMESDPVDCARLFSPLLPMHDAARLITGLWMAVTLLMVGMIGRELWGRGAGRQTTFIFLGSFGLILTTHLLRPEAAGLAGSAMSFYALALAARRPYRAAALLGCGLGISFLALGLLPLLILLLTAGALPLFSAWRNRRYLLVLLIALLIAAPWLAIWPWLAWLFTPDALSAWWQASLSELRGGINYGYFLRTLSWYALPALPLALWGLWVYRRQLLTTPRFQLPVTFFLASLLLLGSTSSPTENDALVLLLPLAAVAGGSIESLRRGAAGLLNWFGLMLFGIMAFLIWLGWFAMLSGWPAKLNERMQVLSGMHAPVFGWIGFIAACAITVIWLLVITNSRRSNRAAVTDWAVGSTMVWSLLMCLWLPWIDSAKNYAGVMRAIGGVVATAPHECIQSRNFGAAQQALLDYYTGLTLEPQNARCNFLLIQDDRGKPAIQPDAEWTLAWQGKRAADRRESFRLYRRNG